eukprot:8191905-Prorocentrum_lima.AAC.1
MRLPRRQRRMNRHFFLVFWSWVGHGLVGWPWADHGLVLCCSWIGHGLGMGWHWVGHCGSGVS